MGLKWTFWIVIQWESIQQTVESHFLFLDLHYNQVNMNHQETAGHCNNIFLTLGNVLTDDNCHWRLLKRAECVSVPPKLCTYAESDWFKGGVQVNSRILALRSEWKAPCVMFISWAVDGVTRKAAVGASSPHHGNLNPTRTSQKTTVIGWQLLLKWTISVATVWTEASLEVAYYW